MSIEAGKVNILIVDDKHDKLLGLEAMLDELGENVVRASSGREALRHLLKLEFAVVLLDVNMPGMDGFETAELMRGYRGSRQTPIIFLTAAGDEMHVTRSYSLGAVDYILTPVVPEVLRTKVSVFVELFRKNRELARQARYLARRAEQLHELTRASLAISAARSLGAIIEILTSVARDIVGVHQAITTTVLEQPAGDAFFAVSLSDKYAAWRGYRPCAGAEGVGALACERDGALRLSARELAARPEIEAAAAGEGGPPVRGLLLATLTELDGRAVGTIQLSDKVDGEFTEDDEVLLLQIAQLGSIAVQNALHAQAREANRLKDEFLATLSHELRTPLTAILGWTRMLRSGSLEPAKAVRALEVIERNTLRQSRLIEELLDVSRIATGKLRIQARPLSLAPVVEAAVDALRPAVEAKEITVVAEIDAAPVEVLGDADRLSQVVANVLGNAVKFTPAGGRIELRLRRARGGVEIVVRDDGEGISREFLPFVFERFRQADSSSRRVSSGLGIGLALVRHIVEAHGGSAEAESPGRGLGSTFTLWFPVTSGAAAEAAMGAPGAAPPSAPRSEGAGELSGVHVLLVEDDEDTRAVVQELLRVHGAKVSAVGSVSEALAAITAERPDVVVSDLAMPGEDGYDLIRRVRARPLAEGGGVPALALTASARREDHLRATSAGFQMHATKPIEPADLIAAVTCLAGHPTPEVSSAPAFREPEGGWIESDGLTLEGAGGSFGTS
jgi:signal transduction histidine kinase/PleD family two-component response regulator